MSFRWEFFRVQNPVQYNHTARHSDCKLYGRDEIFGMDIWLAKTEIIYRRQTEEWIDDRNSSQNKSLEYSSPVNTSEKYSLVRYLRKSSLNLLQKVVPGCPRNWKTTYYHFSNIVLQNRLKLVSTFTLDNSLFTNSSRSDL